MNVVQMATVARDEFRACLFRSLKRPTPTVKLGLLTITGDFGGLGTRSAVICRYGLFAFTGIGDIPCSRSGGQSSDTAQASTFASQPALATSRRKNPAFQLQPVAFAQIKAPRRGRRYKTV